MNLIHPKISSQNVFPKCHPGGDEKDSFLYLHFTFQNIVCILNDTLYKIEIQFMLNKFMTNKFMINKTTLQAQNITCSIWQLMHGNFIIWGWQINWLQNSIWLKTFLNKWMLNWVLLWEDSQLKVKNFVQPFVLPLPWVF